jgi:hypothetical protein
MKKTLQMLLVILVTLSFASVAFAEKVARVPDAVTTDGSTGVPAAWPTVAVNQDAKARPDLEAPVRIVFPSDRCLNPCVGGTGCGAWEVHWEQYCRSVNYYSKECIGAANRYCARKEYPDVIDGASGTTMTTCQTCLY